MRVLCVIDNLASGGAQRQLVTIATGLRRRGHAVRFFVYHPQDFFAAALEAADIDLVRSAKASRWSLQPVLDLRREVRSGSHDIVLSFLETPNIYAELACAGRPRPRLVVSERSSFGLTPPRRSAMLRLGLHRLADYVTTNSHHQREAVERICPWLRGRVLTIWNGVDLDRFTPMGSRRRHETLKLLVVSSIAPFKNGVAVIRALDLLRARGVRPTVTWVGEHQTHIPMRREASEAMKRELALRGLEAQWRWIEPTPEIPQLMREHDALLHPSYLEGLPNAVCEALASGLPVLASNVLEHPRLVQQGTTGLLFDPFDPASLAGAIVVLSEQTDAERRRMSERARAYAEAHLSVATLVDAYERLFASLIADDAALAVTAEAHS